MSNGLRAEPDCAGFEPTMVTEVELGDPLPSLSGVSPGTGRPYRRAQSLVRLHGIPLGLVGLELPAGGLEPASYADEIWRALEQQVLAHLANDGLPEPDRLDAGGLSFSATPSCEREKAAFLVDPPFVSVVIPTRDRPERLERCLDSIRVGGYPPTRYEIVVVDNCPRSDATANLVRPAGRDSPPIRYVREDVSGSASARNRGLRVVEGELVAFTDDDVLVDHNWLVELARGFVRAEDVACVTGLVLPHEFETPAQVWFEEYGGFSRGFERRLFDLHEHRPIDPLYPYTAGVFGTGNNMAFRRSVLRSLGDFDPALGNGTPAVGGVDSEVLLRTIVKGCRISYEPSAFVWHAHRPDYAALRRQVFGYGVGLSAYLLKTLIANPRLIPDFAVRVPRGLAFALSPRSPKNRNKRATYPRELTLAELRGMLYGPLAYARSRRQFGRHG